MDHQGRLKKLQQVIKEQGWEGVILFYSRDIYYFSGTAQPGYLMVRPDDFRLFVRSGLEFALAQSSLPPEGIVAERSLEAACGQMFPGEGGGQAVGTELDLLPVSQARFFEKALGARQLQECSPALLNLRMVKEPEEIACLKEAGSAAHAGHSAALEALKPRVTELELAAAVENAQRLAGHEGMYFFRPLDVVMSRGPLASGPNLSRISGVIFSITGTGLSAAVPAGPSRRALAPGDLVLIDIPPCIRGYHADQTRMYCLGQPPDRVALGHERLRAVADRLTADLRPGMTAGDAYEMAIDEASARGVLDSFMRFPTGVKAHFVGHGIGLEVSEPPLLAKEGREVLRQDMALALEMHLMSEDGVTLKLEDTVVLTDNGCRLLTVSPREIGTPVP
ncbi:MAG: Xaa-Pro peptidase family protein [Desulfarculaceae bacterium]|jgi:Xaa-Pro aminopeptidase